MARMWQPHAGRIAIPKALFGPAGTSTDLRPSIRAVPFGEGPPVLRLSAADREHLATLATVLRVPAGTVLCHRGQESKAVFSVTAGTLAAYRERPDGTRRVLAFLFAEDLFGLARRGTYVNSVKTITPAVVFRMPTDALTALLTRDAALQFRFLCKVTHALRETQRQAIMTTLRDPVERVAVFLGMLEEAQGERRHDRETIQLPMTRQDISDYLNLTTGSIKSSIDALQDRGLIRKETDGSIAVVNRAAFDALVNAER